MNDNIKVFLRRMIVYPVVIFGIFLGSHALAAFLTWDWYHFFHDIDYLLWVLRVSCVFGWIISTCPSFEGDN
jgi:hypothetical protein